MALRIRRGTDPQRSGKTFESGEIVWATDTQQLWVGDGLTQGGIPVVGPSVIGYGLSYNGSTKKIQVSGLTTDDLTQTPTATNRFFTQELAQDAAALLFTQGGHVGITFSYDDDAGRIYATVDPDDIGLTDIINDTTPQLGGNLDLNSKDITGTGNIDILGSLKISQGLGANLSLNSFSVTGTGSIGITGFITDNIQKGESISASANRLTLGTLSKPTELIVNAYSAGSGITLNGYSTGGVGTQVIFNSSQGTLVAPTISADGDILGGIAFRAYNGNAFVQSSSIVSYISDSSILSGNPDISSVVAIGNDINLFAGNGKYLTVFPDGGISAPVVTVGVFATTPTDNRPASPVKGMIIFNDTSGKFQGYNGTTWVDLS